MHEHIGQDSLAVVLCAPIDNSLDSWLSCFSVLEVIFLPFYTVFSQFMLESPLFKSCFFCSFDRSCDTLLANPATALVVPAIGIIVFALWGFLPLVKDIRNRFDVCAFMFNLIF